MRNRSASIFIITLLGIGCGVYNIVNSFEPLFSILGIIAIIISIGIFFLLNIARIVAIIFSILYNLFYLLLIFAYIRSGSHYGWGVGLVVYFPLFIWSLLCIIVCNLPKIKSKFHSTMRGQVSNI